MRLTLTNWQFLLLNEFEELVAGLVTLEEDAGEGRCRGDGVGFLYAAHGHAGVHGFDDDGDAQRVQGLLDAVADLFGQAFLDLQATGEGLHDAGHLGQAGDFALGDVRDVRLADKRQHVMFAQGEKLDVLDDDHMIVRFLKQSALDDGLTVLEVSLCEELHSLGNTLRSFDETFALHILTQQSQNGFYMPRDLLRSFFVVFFYFSVCHGLFFVADFCFEDAKLQKIIKT